MVYVVVVYVVVVYVVVVYVVVVVVVVEAIHLHCSPAGRSAPQSLVDQ